MMPDFSLMALLSIGSFSLGLGTLVMRFFVAPSAKEYLVVAAVIFLVVASAIAIGDWNHRAREVTRLSTLIVAAIGNGEKRVTRSPPKWEKPTPTCFLLRSIN
jgi:uncharacterized membrane protein